PPVGSGPLGHRPGSTAPGRACRPARRRGVASGPPSASRASYTSAVTCPSCGAVTPVGARFCPACGAPLVLRSDERRVVTVLFGDIVGFTTLSETLDPERVKNIVDEVFEALAADIVSYGGQVDKIIGDGIVALFGAPIAHEDDAERAVRAALKMQQTVRSFDAALATPIRMRIGVNTGEALVG